MARVRTTFTLKPEDIEKLKFLSQQRGINQSAYVSELINSRANCSDLNAAGKEVRHLLFNIVGTMGNITMLLNSADITKEMRDCIAVQQQQLMVHMTNLRVLAEQCIAGTFSYEEFQKNMFSLFDALAAKAVEEGGLKK